MTKVTIPRWPLYFLQWTLGITLTGAVLGGLIFPAVGLFVETGYSPLQLTLNGIKIVGFFFAMWAPGTALVLTVKKVYEARRAGDLPEEEPAHSSDA
ncbi:MAG: hypothetical protein J6386_16110 [Candidatus Synoicihabitans palmerolidicus]|nr:hypothetical protein [Candidatus Synoicihabitans palmerolidicus]